MAEAERLGFDRRHEDLKARTHASCLSAMSTNELTYTLLAPRVWPRQVVTGALFRLICGCRQPTKLASFVAGSAGLAARPRGLPLPMGKAGALQQLLAPSFLETANRPLPRLIGSTAFKSHARSMLSTWNRILHDAVNELLQKSSQGLISWPLELPNSRHTLSPLLRIDEYETIRALAFETV